MSKFQFNETGLSARQSIFDGTSAFGDGENDAPIVPDIGILAGFDPVALDVAAGDLCNKAPRLKGTWMDDCPKDGDIFDDAHGNTHWRDAIDHAVRIGLGSADYELIEL